MGVMETPQHTKENDYFRTKAKSTIQITSFAYPKEEKKRGERAKKKRKRRWEYIKGQSSAIKLVVS